MAILIYSSIATNKASAENYWDFTPTSNFGGKMKSSILPAMLFCDSAKDSFGVRSVKKNNKRNKVKEIFLFIARLSM